MWVPKAARIFVETKNNGDMEIINNNIELQNTIHWNKTIGNYLVNRSEMSIDEMGWYVDNETNVPYLNPPFDRSWDMLIHAWHIFTTECCNNNTDLSSNLVEDFNDCVMRNAPRTASELLANAILNRSIVRKVTQSLKCYDKFGEELFQGDRVDVQQAGVHIIWKGKDGHLYFRPYGEPERIKDYFSIDIVKVKK